MKPFTLHDCKRRILHVLVHFQQRPDELLRLDELAEVACFSRFHFHRIFRGMVGESVKEHIRRLHVFERHLFHVNIDLGGGRIGEEPLDDAVLAAERGVVLIHSKHDEFRCRVKLKPEIRVAKPA